MCFLQADLAVCRWLLGWAKAVHRDSLHEGYRAVDAKANAAIKAVRNSADAPYWDTYLAIEKIAEQWRKEVEAPRFTRFDGSGRCVVQLSGGLTVAEALSGTDTRLRILPATPRIRHDGSTAPIRDEYRTVKLRVTSDEAGKPVWVTLPFVMHRPLPEDGLIKWAWVLRRREGMRYHYDLQITIEAESWRAPQATGNGTVAVDIGTRDMTDGLRVALWLDSEGRSGEVTAQKLRLSSPTSRGAGRRKVVPIDDDKVESLHSIRDRHLDTVKLLIISLREGASEWYRERTQHAHQWRAPGRVAALLRDWIKQGETWDFARGWGALGIATYLAQDRHLLDWETNQRRRSLARRQNAYRIFAAQLASTYDTIVIAARDYRREAPPPEEGIPSQGRVSRSYMREAAPGELRAAIVAAAKARGVRLIEVPLEGDTVWALDQRVCTRLLTSAATPSSEAQFAKRARRPQGRRIGTAARIDPLAGVDITPL